MVNNPHQLLGVSENATQEEIKREEVAKATSEGFAGGARRPVQSGSAAKTGIVNATEYASKTGANVIAITDSMSSPIVEHAAVALIAKSEMASFVDSLVAPMSVINALIATIGKKKNAEIIETLERLGNVWKEYNVYTSAETREKHI